MDKVVEYLDKEFNIIWSSDATSNGGKWEYRKNDSIVYVSINNQTLQLRCKIDGKYIKTLYGYLQTYKHIPRGEPDINGYYTRSTDDEVIRYINVYFKKVDFNFFRVKKLKKILNKDN